MLHVRWLLLVTVVACHERTAAPPEQQAPAPTPPPPALAAAIEDAGLGTLTPRTTQSPPRASGQLAGETILGAVRMHQGDLKQLVFRKTGELWALSWDGVLSSTQPKAPLEGSNGLWIWDPAKRQVLRRIDRRITAFAIAETGGVIATLDRIADRVALLDLATFAERWSVPLTRPDSIGITPDGKTIIVGDAVGIVHVLDPADGHEVWSQQTHPGYVAAVAVSPSGRYFATAGQGLDAVIRTSTTRETVATVHHVARRNADDDDVTGVTSIAFSPDERAVATGGWDRTVRVFDLPSGKPRLVVQDGQDVLAVAWSPDGAWLASGGRNNDVKLWRATDGAAGPAIAGHGSMVDALAFSGDGKVLASGASGGQDFMIKLWNVATGAEIGGGGHGDSVRFLDVSSDGKSMISIGADRRVIDWDLRSNTERGSFTEQYFTTQYALAADAKLVARADDGNKTALLRVPQGTVQTRVDFGVDALLPDKLALTRDGTLLAALFEPTINVYAVASGKRVQSFKSTATPTSAIGFCDRGRALWYLALDGFTVLDIASGKRRGSVPAPKPGDLATIKVSPDCTRVVTTAWFQPEQGITVREVATHRVLFSVPGYADPELSIDGTLIAARSTTGLAVIDAATGKVLHAYPGHASEITALAFLPDGRVVSGGKDALIKIWPDRR